jgi:hypothetical protein
LALWLLFSSGQVFLTTLDKSSGLLTIQRWGLWKRMPLNYRLYEVAGVELEEKKPSFGQKGSYRLKLVLTSQQKVSLTNIRTFNAKNCRSLQASCDRINQFLNS